MTDDPTTLGTTKPDDPDDGDRPWDAPTLVRRAGRLVLVGCIVWSGWSGASAWSELLSRPAPRAQARDLPIAPDPSVLVARWLAGGRWVLGEGDRPVAVARLTSSDAEARVMALSGDAGQRDGFGPAGAELVALVRSFAGPGETDGSITVYHARRRGLFLRAFTRRDAGGKEVLTAARLAVRWGGDGASLVFETLGGGRGPVAGRIDDGLIPLPGRARRVAARYDDAGRTLGEVIQVEATPDGLVSGWKREGWFVWGGPGLGPETGPRWSCEKGGDVLQVWALGPGRGPGALVLLLMREPVPVGVSSR